MFISISNSSTLPIYAQIAKQIKQKILSSELKQGDALPSIRQLAQETRVSVITTKRAYEELVHEGFLDSVQGKGFYVSSQNKDFIREQKLKQIEALLEEAVKEAQLINIDQAELSEMISLFFENKEV